MTRILGIETSCDETAAAVVERGRWVRSNVVASQHELHSKYGGVVPEIASRAHLERIMPVINEALASAGTTLDQLDAVAVGHRPGLIGSLLVGVSAAKALAWATDKPLIGVDHVHAHLHGAALVDAGSEDARPACDDGWVRYPALGLVVSGGHTSLFEISGPGQMVLLGKTIDDAVGEAYDKAAVILDAGYPGGPRVDKLAQTGTPAMQLPRSTLGRDSLDFSFSGLKTALLYAVRGRPVRRQGQVTFERSGSELTDEQRADFAAAFQQAAIGVLMVKVERAFVQLTEGGSRPRSFIIGGGVSANSLLREKVRDFGIEHKIDVHIPPMAYCLDNAAMIAGLADHSFAQGDIASLDLPAIATTRDLPTARLSRPSTNNP